MYFGEILRELRIDANKTQEELANIIGVSSDSISKYENGNREPSFDILIKFANYFDVSLDYLLGRTNIKIPYYIIAEIKNKPESKTFDNIISILRKNTKNLVFIYSLLKFMDENKKL